MSGILDGLVGGFFGIIGGSIAENNAYPTPFHNNIVLPLLLLSLSRQKVSPDTKSTFKEEYDYIIVGAGSAGAVVASRLSEMPCVSVLLLEAGKPPPLISDAPALSRNLWFTDLDWQYKTVPQKYTGDGLVNRQVIWPSGKALGGSSIINAMLYVRGNKKNYDDWAEGGAEGWSYKDVLKYFLKAEDNKNIRDPHETYHARRGTMTVEKPGYYSEIRGPINEAAKSFGYKYLDSNGAQQTGFFDFQATMRNGQRCSTAKAYLVPADKRKNLDILPHAFVRKVIIENGRAVGVEFEHGGKTHQVRAKREVIMSAGATNTPQLLMLSGIGPREHLEKLKIPVEADLPVGDNLQDHCGTPAAYVLDSKYPSIAQKSQSPLTFFQYLFFRTGLLSSAEGISAMSFLSKDVKSNVDFPKFELYLLEVTNDIARDQLGLKPEVYKQYAGPYESSTTYYCISQILQPKSRGTVRLNSTNPHDPPLIDPNYLQDPEDLQDIVDGLKVCQKIGRSDPIKKMGGKPFETLLPGCESLKDDEDKYLECTAKSVVITFSHMVGTAKMGNPDDPTTVVDPKLRVKGIKGLRVVDASIMPIVPSGNTNIPTIMVGEKASDMIKSTIKCEA